MDGLAAGSARPPGAGAPSRTRPDVVPAVDLTGGWSPELPTLLMLCQRRYERDADRHDGWAFEAHGLVLAVGDYGVREDVDQVDHRQVTDSRGEWSPYNSGSSEPRSMR